MPRSQPTRLTHYVISTASTNALRKVHSFPERSGPRANFVRWRGGSVGRTIPLAENGAIQSDVACS